MSEQYVVWKTDPVTRANNLKNALQKRIIKRAATASIPPVVAAVKSGAGKVRRYGYLEKSISKKVKSYRTPPGALAGPWSKSKRRKGVRTRGKNTGKPIYHYPAKYMRLVDRGTSRARAKPILKPALDLTKRTYFNTLTAQIKVEIARELAKNR